MGSEENVKMTWFKLVSIGTAWTFAFLETVSFVLLDTTLFCSSPASRVSLLDFSLLFSLDCRHPRTGVTYSFFSGPL